MTNYTYDGLGRLTSEAVTGENPISYTYDDSNNRHTMTIGSSVTTYNYDRDNRLVTEVNVNNGITETTRYSYDNNGNQTCKDTSTIKPTVPGEVVTMSAIVLGEGKNDADVTTSEYDGFNQLIKVSTGNIITDYTYNPDGLRASKTVNGTTTKHIWDGDQIALELDGSENVIKSMSAVSISYFLQVLRIQEDCITCITATAT